MADSHELTRRSLLRYGGIGAATAGVLASTSGAEPGSKPGTSAPPYRDGDLGVRIGDLHGHTGYSDGEPGTTPADAFSAGREAGWDFMAVTEHSEWFPLPITGDERCLDPSDDHLPDDCVISPADDPDGLRKWDAVQEQADAESTGEFLGVRGFEWSSQYQGHVVVTGSENYSTAYETGGATMDGFWEWFTRDPELGGGADGLAIFAHPGREPETFEDFRYVPEAADRVVGTEVFNRGSEYFEGGLAGALDAGWRVGAVGASDDHGPNWDREDRAKTALVVPDDDPWTRATIRSTLLERRFYATFNHQLRFRVRADGREMGSTVRGAPGRAVEIEVDAFDARHPDSIQAIVLYSNGAEPVASTELGAPDRRATLSYDAEVPADGTDWYVAKVVGADGLEGPDRGSAYSSPVWLTTE